MTSRAHSRFLLSLALLLLPGAARPSHATATPEALRVIQRYVDATGGTEACNAERTLYMRGRIEGFGFTGTIESWSARPDRQFSRTVLGPFKLSEGNDGESCWRTDPTTGRVVRLTDRDSLDSQISTWFGLERWTEPAQAGGHVEVAGQERDTTGRYTVLAVTAPGQSTLRPRRLWFSDATGLLMREETQRDQSWIVTELGNYRKSGARLRAFTNSTGVSNMPANRMSTVVDSFAVNPDVSAVPFAMPDSAGGNALRWLAHEGEAVLPFEYRTRHVWLKASIDGGPERDFLFDTGASITVIDSSFAAASGFAVEGRMQAAGAGAAGSATFAHLGSLAVRGADGDGVELRDLRVGVLSVSPAFSRYFWREFAGVIGYDVISRFVVTLDFDSTRMVLHDPKTFQFKGTAPALPMKLNGTVPSLEGTLDGQYTGQFRLDVGSSSTVDIHTPFAEHFALGRRLRYPHEVSGAGFGGTFTSVLGRMRTMSLGPWTWKDPMVTLARATEGAFASEDFAGNVGNRILERFRVTLDYDGRRIWLEPGKRFGARDAFTRTGFLLGWTPERIEVLSVLPGSPAEKAKLREGDRVLAVDGRAIDDWNPAALDELLEGSGNGRRVRIKVDRDGAPRELTMTLREMLK